MTQTITRRAPSPVTDVLESWPLSLHRAGTRALAIDEGTLVPAMPALALEAGWEHPVAYTAPVHSAWIAWSEAAEAAKRYPTCQDETCREWDVLFMARAALRRESEEGPAWTFTLSAVPTAGPHARLEDVRLIARLGPGDRGEPVVTIMEAAHG